MKIALVLALSMIFVSCGRKNPQTKIDAAKAEAIKAEKAKTAKQVSALTAESESSKKKMVAEYAKLEGEIKEIQGQNKTLGEQNKGLLAEFDTLKKSKTPLAGKRNLEPSKTEKKAPKTFYKAKADVKPATRDAQGTVKATVETTTEDLSLPAAKKKLELAKNTEVKSGEKLDKVLDKVADQKEANNAEADIKLEDATNDEADKIMQKRDEQNEALDKVADKAMDVHDKTSDNVDKAQDVVDEKEAQTQD